MSNLKFSFEENSNIKINLQAKDNLQNENIEENIGNSKDDFIPLKKIGEGAYGTIITVKSKRNNKIYIMKILDKKGSNDDVYNKRELLILQKLNHPNIVKYYSSFEDNQNYYIIIEYIKGSTLYDFYMSLNLKKRNIEEKIIWDLLGQCLDALVYIHGKAVIHRDLKFLNILIDEKMNLKIIDFNTSAIMDKTAASNYENNKNKINQIINNGTEVNNQPFRAPEAPTNNYNAKIDVYSAGKIFQFLFNINGNYGQYSDELKKIIDEMIIENAQNRKTSNEIYKLYKQYYSMKYFKYSSIFSCLHCLFNYPIWNNIFTKIDKKNMKSDISKFFFDSLIALKKKSQNFELYIKEFKKNKLNIL